MTFARVAVVFPVGPRPDARATADVKAVRWYRARYLVNPSLSDFATWPLAVLLVGSLLGCNPGVLKQRAAGDGGGAAGSGVVCDAAQCVIEDECVDDQAVGTENGCQVCDVSANATAWTPRTGEPCEDGRYCTGSDFCDESGSCVGVGVGDPCASGDDCNNTCNEEQKTCYSPVTATCDDGLACKTDDKCDGAGVCAGTSDLCGADGSCDEEVAMCAGFIQRVNLSSEGVEADRSGSSASISADGRFIAFASSATDLVAEDTNEREDVFVRDMQTGTTTRVSVSSVGAQGNGQSSSPSMSADGRFVAFTSTSTNFAADGPTNAWQVFLHDLVSGETTRVSVSSEGAPTTGGGASVSGDGNFVAFSSTAWDVVPDDMNGQGDIFVRDTQTGVTERVSLGPGGVETNGSSEGPSISGDGRFVAFQSVANNLVAIDANRNYDIFVHDRVSGETRCVSVSSEGESASDDSFNAVISANGRFVAFESDAANLVAETTSAARNVFLHDTQTGVTTNVTVSSTGLAGNHFAFDPSISADGRYVAYHSDATNLVSGDINGRYDVFVHDTQTASTERVNVSLLGVTMDNSSTDAKISADGRFVVFESYATKIVANDTNETGDLFRVDTWELPE